MEEHGSIIEIRRREKRKALVFVHGLQGDPRLSWQQFLEFVEQDKGFDDWDIYSFGYRFRLMPILSASTSFKILGLSFYTQLSTKPLAEYESFSIVAHSEGGLIVQSAVVNHEDLAARVAQVFFFATPSAGLSLLSLERFQPLVRVFEPLVFTPLFGPLLKLIFDFLLRGLSDLRPGSPFLTDLAKRWQERFAERAPFQYWAIAAERDAFVPVESSLLAFASEHRLVAPGSHVSVIKPESPDAISLRIVRNALVAEAPPEETVQAAKGTITLASKQEADEFDVFLYHSSTDGSEARQIAEQLKLHGIRPWLTEDHVIPGRSRKDPLFKDIDRIRSAAILIGKGGPAFWDKDEQTAMITDLAKRGLPLIPIYLTDAPANSDLPHCISDLEPVDFRDAGSEPIERLVGGIRGRPPVRRAAPKPVAAEVIPDETHRSVPVKKRRKWLAIASVAMVLLAFGGWRLYEHWVDCGKLADLPIIHHSGRDTPHYVRHGSDNWVIIFVHGIFGNAEGTWTNAPDTYWPELIAKDEQFGNPDIYVAAYETGVGNRMTIDEVSEGLYQRFYDAGVFTRHRHVVLVCHSLGGLVTQRMLLKHRDLAEKVALIYFYATPQTGAQIARIGTVFSDDPLLKEMAPGSSNDYLRTMESDWENAGFRKIQRLCAYEKLKYKCVLIVDDLSGTRGCDNAVALNKNHATIVKPASKDDESYILLRNAWRDLGTTEHTQEAPSSLLQSSRSVGFAGNLHD